MEDLSNIRSTMCNNAVQDFHIHTVFSMELMAATRVVSI